MRTVHDGLHGGRARARRGEQGRPGQGNLCDGLGACLDVCPTDALKIVERESDDYDARDLSTCPENTRKRRRAACPRRRRATRPRDRKPAPHFHAGCPGSMAREIARDDAPKPEQSVCPSIRSELSQWPIQLHLVSPLAPYFQGADLLVAADCTAFSLGGFHSELLKGRSSSSPVRSSTTPKDMSRSWPSSSRGTTSTR